MNPNGYRSPGFVIATIKMTFLRSCSSDSFYKIDRNVHLPSSVKHILGVKGQGHCNLMFIFVSGISHNIRKVLLDLLPKYIDLLFIPETNFHS